MKIEKISDIYEVLKGYTRKKRLVVAFANDSHSIEAVYMAVSRIGGRNIGRGYGDYSRSV